MADLSRIGIGMGRPAMGRGGAFGAGVAPPILSNTWKIISRDVDGGGFTTGSEMRWLDKDGVQISTAGATHTGSAPQSGTPSLLFNGNLTDFYQTAVVINAFVQTVFAAPVAVKGFAWLPLSGFATRCPRFVDVYYNNGAGDVYAFTAAHTWAGNLEVIFMDPGLGAQTDWIIMGLTCQGTSWFQGELEIKATQGGADLTAPGGTVIFSLGNSWDLPKTIDNDPATFNGTTGFRPYDYIGARLAAAADAQQLALWSRAGFNTSQSILSGAIYAGANRGYRLRKSFAGLTWPTDPTIQLFNIP